LLKHKRNMARKLGFDFFFRLLSVAQMEPTVVEIDERSLEFCLLHLEKSSYACDDFGLLVSFLGFILIWCVCVWVDYSF